MSNNAPIVEDRSELWLVIIWVIALIAILVWSRTVDLPQDTTGKTNRSTFTPSADVSAETAFQRCWNKRRYAPVGKTPPEDRWMLATRSQTHLSGRLDV